LNYFSDKLKYTYEKNFDSSTLPRIPNNKNEISRCEINGKGFEIWDINYTYNGKIYNLYKEEDGEFHWDSYPKDWSKIGIIMFLMVTIFFIILILRLL
jgi:hypothetical protein